MAHREAILMAICRCRSVKAERQRNTRIWGDPGTTYKYDGDGNLVQEQDCTNNADSVKYEYTAENRLAVVSQGGTVLMAAMYDGDNNRVFQIDNTYKWEDCYGDEVLIPKSERTENGDSPQEELASLVKGGENAKGYTLTEYVNDVNRENTEEYWITVTREVVHFAARLRANNVMGAWHSGLSP